MKRFFAFIVVAFFIFYGPTMAQTPVIENRGPVIDNFNNSCEQVSFIQNDGHTANFYFSSIGNSKKADQQAIISYNLNNNHTVEKTITTPFGYHHLYTNQPIHEESENGLISYYYRVNHETQNFEYAIAEINNLSKNSAFNITPKQRLTLHLSGRGEVMKYIAISPDTSKYAINFIVPNDKNQAPYFYTFVYDNNGKELWYNKFIPQISGSKFSVQDVQLDNNGSLLLLLYSSRGKNQVVFEPTVQLFICKKDTTLEASQPIDFGYITSMKLLQMKSKDYFIGGYYEAENKGYSSGYFNITFDDYTLKTISQMYAPFAVGKQKEIFDDIEDDEYFVKCDYIYELGEKTIVMLGEQFTSLIDGKNYIHHMNDIFVNKFMLDGKDMGYNRINKHQQLSTSAAVSSHSYGERISGTFLNEKGEPERIASFHELSLSYYPIRKGDQIYVLYTDKASNYREEQQNIESANIQHPEELCVALAKINYNMDKKVILLPESKSDQLFRGIMLNDDNTIYFGMAGKKNFSIEHFDLNERWSWDK